MGCLRKTNNYSRLKQKALAAQQQIQYEVAKNLQKPFTDANQTLYELLDLRDLEASSAAELKHRWSHCQLQSDYRNFIGQWVEATNQERAGVEFRFALLYQEVKILEQVADLECFALEAANNSGCKYCCRLENMSVVHMHSCTTLQQSRKKRSRKDRQNVLCAKRTH